MATAKELARLFSAIAVNDISTARSIALGIAHAEGDRGHHSAGRLLRGALQPNGKPDSQWPSSGGQPGLLPGGFRNALTPITSLEPLAEVVLSQASRGGLIAIAREWRGRQLLEQKRLRRRNKL